jgi:hypothetical protein
MNIILNHQRAGGTTPIGQTGRWTYRRPTWQSGLPVLTAFLIALFSGGGVWAAPQLALGIVHGSPGATVDVPVYLQLDTPSATRITGVQADVLFNGGVITIGTLTPSPTASNYSLRGGPVASGRQRILIHSPDDQTLPTGMVATVRVTIGASTSLPAIPLTLTNVLLATDLGERIALTSRNGVIVLNQFYHGADGSFAGTVAVQPNRRYTVQASTNLVQWLNLSVQDVIDPMLFFVDPDAPQYPYRFYRAVSAPERGQF